MLKNYLEGWKDLGILSASRIYSPESQAQGSQRNT